MGARQDKRPITNKTHLAKISWIPGDITRALVANNFPTLGALKKGLGMADPRGRIIQIMKRNVDDLAEVEPLIAKINDSPASDRRPQANL
ncbi:hypothetical protein A3E39_02710 [Candidatus Uhrbacteria bacterium RIFCSPHIGHO2_12_FULL_60_25]|uniref:Uncharacterized protein n=1 Tax=Candidatus Uhrbacteria bacterium RIFCSPHIGHO2_12_FULL_60_25 TaxID=1802399 RepID=A0A1F7UJF1_9BACT|nr:MAG: hypothetical protein A3D73_03735 [Candidatus Uhrbacteria bacterium RIFCSPHIGHO2_02_FULL_60_44]OGL78389.1 MAG: hypothetical protein A3E39_02710 [Candidatus Uhrbacteria bacterium RIFCSPHIGHO2_12_FULL_60_25]